VLFGPSGVGKSFLALDWSACIATGLAWYGRESKPGPVVYIAAEGAGGLYPRVSAWQTARGTPPGDIRFIPEAINLLQPADTQTAENAIARLADPPALIVVDTMARCMVGGDENSARDVGQFIAAVDRLRLTFDSAALVVHHTGKDGADERGSSALRGAADMMHALKPAGANARLECVKAKDAAPYDPWRLHLQPTAESCVLRLGTNDGRMSPHERAILETVSEVFGTDGASATPLLDASGVPKSSFYRALNALVQRDFLQKGDGARGRYTVTTDGAAALEVPNGPNESHETGANGSSHPSPYRDGGTTERQALDRGSPGMNRRTLSESPVPFSGQDRGRGR
jgi:AAA domain